MFHSIPMESGRRIVYFSKLLEWVISMDNKLFLCAACGKLIKSITSPEVIEKEYQRLYGHSQAESEDENVSICGNCYQELLSNDIQAEEYN